MDMDSFKILIRDEVSYVYGLKLEANEINDIVKRITDSYEFGYEIGFCDGCEKRKT